MNVRPVYGRYLRRALGLEIGPPTDPEKRDAILILKDGPWFRDRDDGVWIEAQRVLCEASES